MNKAFLKTSLCSKETAEKLAQKAQHFVPAYKRYLEKHGLKPGEHFEKLPTSDKKSYALVYPYEEFLVTDEEEIFTLFHSSGSSGNSFYVKILQSASEVLPDLITVRGRADSCLIIGAANLMEYMLDEAVKNEDLSDILTGLYRARILYEEKKQYLSFDLESIQVIALNQEKKDRVYYSLVKTLGHLEPYFLEAYNNLYRIWDTVPTKRILRLNFLSWPSLSQTTETSIKQRGIVQ